MEYSKTLRLFVINDLAAGQTLTINGKEGHYIQNVMRLRVGDALRLFNGRDGEWLATLSALGKNVCEIQLKTRLRPQTQDTDIWLCCAPIKKAHFEYMIEKTTELGASVIQPMLTAHTQVRDVNTERLTTIAKEAAEQSERLSVPEIRNLVSLDALLSNWPKDRTLILCAEFGNALSIRDAFRNLTPQQIGKVGIMVGPEGGFQENELGLVRQRHEALFVRLGARILRADTAAIAALTCWQALCGDWTSDETPVT